MTSEEKFDLVVEVVAKIEPDIGTYCHFNSTSENGLDRLTKTDVYIALHQLANDEKVISFPQKHPTELNRRIIGIPQYDEKTGKKIIVPVRKKIENEHPSERQKHEFNFFKDERLDDWYKAFQFGKSHTLNQLTCLNFLKIYKTVLAINEKFQMQPSDQITISLFIDQPLSDRQDALAFLKNKGIVKSYARSTQHFSINLNTDKFMRFLKEVETEHSKREDEIRLNEENEFYSNAAYQHKMKEMLQTQIDKGNQFQQADGQVKLQEPILIKIVDGTIKGEMKIEGLGKGLEATAKMKKEQDNHLPPNTKKNDDKKFRIGNLEVNITAGTMRYKNNKRIEIEPDSKPIKFLNTLYEKHWL